MGLTTRLRLARLQLVTDTRGGGRPFADFCVDVFRAGVDMLVVREPGLPAAQLTEALELARSVALQLNKLVVVSQEVAVATDFGADVVQLDALAPAAAAKAAQHPYALVGAATHDEAGLARALADEAVSYVTVGPVFGGRAAPRFALPGLDLVRTAAAAAPVADVAAKPWFAIGGLDLTTLDDVLAAGARRVVLTRQGVGTSEPAAVVRAVADRLRDAWQADDTLDGYALAVFGGMGTGLTSP